MSDDLLDVSVVIGFKDWGSRRLLTSVASIVDAIVPLRGEVIVSDYGSVDGPVLREPVEALGARYVYTATDGVWSRSRALNAGFAQAKGRVLISTDADMLFSPGSFARIVETVDANPGTAVVLQCRNLPEGYSEAELADATIDWAQLERVSRVRPRWGMGGMIAVPCDAFLRSRGLDERMQVYGGEDIDFANRLRRLGLKLHWIERDDVRMYHMWHPPSRDAASRVQEGRAAIEANRAIMLEDASIVRNVPVWRHRLEAEDPLVSVVIATRNRARLLEESIRSVLAQSFADFELLVVDDGSTDATRDVVEGFDDPRVRYVHQEHGGVPAARNLAAGLSRGVYTAIHDDDDIMLPWRLEASLAAIHEGYQGAYGGSVDFDDATGEMTADLGRDFSLAALLYSSKVYKHATLLIETSILRKFGYNETLRSGSDYNLAVRLARAGVRLRHSGEFHILRRLHGVQLTARDPQVQGHSARMTVAMVESHLGASSIAELRAQAKQVGTAAVRGAETLEQTVGPYLPDNLVSRSVRVPAEEKVIRAAGVTGPVSEIAVVADGGTTAVWSEVDDASWPVMHTLRRAGLDWQVTSARRLSVTGGDVPRPAGVRRSVDGFLASELQTYPELHWLTVADGAASGLDSVKGARTVVLKLGGTVAARAIGFTSLADATNALASIREARGTAAILTRGSLEDPLLIDQLSAGVANAH